VVRALYFDKPKKIPATIRPHPVGDEILAVALMLDFLGSADQPRVQDFVGSVLLRHFLALFNQALHCLALLALWLLAEFLKNAFQPGDLLLGPFEVLLESRSQLLVGGGFCPLRKRPDELLFRIVDVLKLFSAFRFRAS
jgi:hypothetical protein